MYRFRIAAVCALALGMVAPLTAQDATVPDFESELDLPSASSSNQAALPGEPVISLNMPANPSDLLTGLLATRALIEVCDVPLDINIASAMDTDQAAFAQRMQIAPEAVNASYAQIRTATETRGPDCADGSDDRQGIDAVVSVYRDSLSAPAAVTTTPAAAPAATSAPANSVN
jgi:hypothetical protein